MTTTRLLLHSVAAAALVACAAGSAHAQSSQGVATQLEDVVVTARKVEERAQTVPIAITAVTGEQLIARGVQHVSDLQYTVPSLVFSQTATSSFSPLVSLRAQTQGTIAISVDPSVGVYVDGVYLTGTAGLMSDSLVDIQRVEVLKGPQGTLFGRNTTGGAISFYTNLPTDKFEGQVSAGVGNYNRRMANGVLNLPLGEIGALRLVGSTSQRDGFGRDLARNVNVGDQKLSSLRGALKLDPTDKLQFIIRADGTSGKDNGLLTHPLYILADPTLSVVRDAAIGGFGADTPANRLAAIAAYQQRIALDPFQVRYNTPAFSTIDTGNASVTASYDLGSVQLKGITAIRHTKDVRRYEVDATELVNFDSLTTIHLRQITHELQLTGQAMDNRLKYAVGAFYYDLKGDESSRGIQFGNLTGGGYSLTAADVTDRSWAVYSQATYALTDAVKVTGGLRYTDETKTVNALGGSGATAASAFVCQLPAALNPDLVACRAKVETSGNDTSYTLALDWTPTPGVLLYGRTGRGYKAGTINQRIVGANPLAGNKVAPEQVTDYELGVKSDWLDKRLRINADIYRSNYDNIQRSSVVCAPACTSVLQNAARAVINGAELEVTALPMRGVNLGFTAAYTDPSYERYISGGLDNSRERFLEVPKWTYSVSAGYTHETSVGKAHGQLDWSWRDDMDMAPQDYAGGIRVVAGVPTANGPGTPDSIRIQKAYGLLNGTLSLDLDQYNATIRLFGSNLLDERYYSHALGNANALGVTIGTPGAPRTYGVDVTVRF